LWNSALEAKRAIIADRPPGRHRVVPEVVSQFDVLTRKTAEPSTSWSDFRVVNSWMSRPVLIDLKSIDGNSFCRTIPANSS
jgi:hypothetical protein